MIVTCNWLREFVDFDFSPEDLAHKITMAGLEVEAVEKLGEGLDSVIVARLKSVEAHPDAEKLTLCVVETGNEEVQVVCGAPNHKTGDLVALAQVGTVLPGNFKIKKSKIRGCESMGMLCSEKELGLAEDSDGIMILPQDLSLGTPVFNALQMKDIRLEIGLTPNRSDCLSVFGVSREVAALASQPLRFERPIGPFGEGDINAETSIMVEEAELCPRYTARLIHGVKIGPSPGWLVRRLESVGVRSINNVVDVTNFVMMELGQPLHAFDFNLLRGKRIVVKRAASKEVFKTLDGKEHALCEDDLVICDGEGAVALAGVMGGENSEIEESTTDVLLESAYFDPNTVRRTSKRLGIHTEASHRFERGIDLDMVPAALERATQLIVEIAGGKPAKGMIDVFSPPQKRPDVPISTEKTNALLGIELQTSEIKRLLESIGLRVTESSADPGNILYVEVPAFRHDLEREVDLIEEVARLHGYDDIPATLPSGEIESWLIPPTSKPAARIRENLIGRGFSEVVNYSFVSPQFWDRILLADSDSRRSNIKLLNPLTEEQSVMRTTLVPSLLETVSKNLAYRSIDLKLFEMRPVFEVLAGEETALEKLTLSLAICGRREPEGWAQSNEGADFYDLKGVVEDIFNLFSLNRISWDGSSCEPFFHPGKSCTLKAGENVLGKMGEIHPKVLENFEIDVPVYMLELDVETLLKAAGKSRKILIPSKFPETQRDTAFMVDLSVDAQGVFDAIRGIKSPYLKDYVLFDLYRGSGIPEGKKSLAVRIRYGSDERTLTDEEVNKAHQKIVDSLCNRLGAEIR
jgi:phenylalanyl-tRNA synthetase beta chain